MHLPLLTLSISLSLYHTTLATPLLSTRGNDAPKPVNTTTCNTQTYTYTSLAGFGKLPSDIRDKYGDTIGVGSAIAIDKSSVRCRKTKKNNKNKSIYEGIIYGLPDRGWNTQGTQNTQARIHRFGFTFDSSVVGTSKEPAQPNFELRYEDTILLTGPDGKALTGLDPTGSVEVKGFGVLPVATYTGDGFGGPGAGGSLVPIDAEGLVLGLDGTFWISDEYAAAIYQFSAAGEMLQAIHPPAAFTPLRNGSVSFSAASPPIYDQQFKIVPEQPTSGRGNNQGLEALTRSPDGKFLYTMLQSATVQDGGTSSSKRRNTRFLTYSVKKNKELKLVAEYAVQLPVLPTGRVASQSEMHYISPTQFLVLSRDSGAGHGLANSTSIYRNADVIDISSATNVLGTAADAVGGQIASKDGVLNAGITPAKYCPWLSYNNNDELVKFGLHNGGKQDIGLLNEKWESFALIKVDEDEKKGSGGDEYFLVSFSDNDFITQNGFINSGKIPYKDASGYDLDTQVLVFRITLPKGADPL